VVLAIAVVATHYYGIFFLAGEGLALLILRPRPLRGWLPEGVVAGALCAGIVLAAARAVEGVFAGQYVFGITALPGVVWSMLTGYTLLPTSEQLHALGTWAILPYLPIALMALPAFALVAAAGVRALDRTARIVLLTTFGVALAAPFAYRLALGAGVHPRYFAAAIAPIFVVTAVGMAQARIASPRGVATVLLATIMLYATSLHLRDTGHGREDVAAAWRWLDANVPADEEILVTSSEMEILARFHWPHRRFRLYPSERGAIPSDEMATVVASMPFDEGHQRAIFVVGRAWLTDPDGKLQTALAERYAICPGADVPGIRIHCYEPRTEATVATAAR